MPDYTPTTWVNHYEDPATGEVFQEGTPVDAEHLNKMEQGIVGAHGKVDTHTAGTTIHITGTERDTWNAKATTRSWTATLSTTWAGTGPWTQTVTVSGMTAIDNPMVDVVLSTVAATAKAQLEAWGLVGQITTAENTITATCLEKKPTVAIPIQLKAVR